MARGFQNLGMAQPPDVESSRDCKEKGPRHGERTAFGAGERGDDTIRAARLSRAGLARGSQGRQSKPALEDMAEAPALAGADPARRQTARDRWSEQATKAHKQVWPTPSGRLTGLWRQERQDRKGVCVPRGLVTILG